MAFTRVTIEWSRLPNRFKGLRPDVIVRSTKYICWFFELMGVAEEFPLSRRYRQAC